MLKFLPVVLLVTVTHVAAADCVSGSPDVMKLIDWTLGEQDGEVTVTSTYENLTSKNIRMINGFVMFTDPFGQFVGSVHMGPDASISGSEPYTETNLAMSTPRLTTINRDDIEAASCVMAVVYEDGTKEEF